MFRVVINVEVLVQTGLTSFYRVFIYLTKYMWSKLFNNNNMLNPNYTIQFNIVFSYAHKHSVNQKYIVR